MPVSARSVLNNLNAAEMISNEGEPNGTRVNGPVPRELSESRFMKIISLAPEVL